MDFLCFYSPPSLLVVSARGVKTNHCDPKWFSITQSEPWRASSWRPVAARTLCSPLKTQTWITFLEKISRWVSGCSASINTRLERLPAVLWYVNQQLSPQILPLTNHLLWGPCRDWRLCNPSLTFPSSTFFPIILSLSALSCTYCRPYPRCRHFPITPLLYRNGLCQAVVWYSTCRYDISEWWVTEKMMKMNIKRDKKPYFKWKKKKNLTTLKAFIWWSMSLLSPSSHITWTLSMRLISFYVLHQCFPNFFFFLLTHIFVGSSIGSPIQNMFYS